MVHLNKFLKIHNSEKSFINFSQYSIMCANSIVYSCMRYKELIPTTLHAQSQLQSKMLITGETYLQASAHLRLSCNRIILCK